MSNHSFGYLGNKSWSQITREERFFCSHLYYSILNKGKEFINWLNDNLKNNNNNLKLNPDKEWEIGYEVCFYRDYIKAMDSSIKQYNKDKEKDYPQKRTFDLCLFSEDQIIIIEAKVQQGFSTKQINEIQKDKILVKQLLSEFNYDNVKSETILLYSSGYSPKEDQIIEYPYFTWKQIHNSNFELENCFEGADGKFRK